MTVESLLGTRDEEEDAKASMICVWKVAACADPNNVVMLT